MTISNFDELQEELRKDIIDFITNLRDPILKEINNSPTTVLGIKRPGVPNPYCSYLHGKLQQEAKEHPEYSVLSDAGIEMIDPSQNNGISPASISNKVVIGVEETYTASSCAYLQNLTKFEPLSIFYVTAKPQRFETIYKKPKSVSGV